MTGEQALPECKVNVDLLRSIAVGVQGLAETFATCHLPFKSEQAAQLNQLIFEHMYYWALVESNELVDKYGPYPGWDVVGPNGEVPPLKRGLFHWQLTGVQPAPMKTAKDSCANSGGASPGVTPLTLNRAGSAVVYTPDPIKERGRHAVRIPYTHLDWDGLRQKIVSKGIANSMVLALMPTMSTSKIMGWTDSFEPSENLCIFKNNASSGSMHVFKPLDEDLHQLNLYSPSVLGHLQSQKGSIQKLTLPSDLQWLKQVYLTVYEVEPQVRLNLSITTQAFIDQAMSLNAYFDIPTKSLLTTWHIKAWRGGLKTGSYYTRSKPAILGAKVGTSSSGSGAALPLKKAVAKTSASTGKSGGGAAVGSGRASTGAGRAAKSAVASSESSSSSSSSDDVMQCRLNAAKNGVDCDSCSG